MANNQRPETGPKRSRSSSSPSSSASSASSATLKQDQEFKRRSAIRPPRTLRERVFHVLPYYTGPHTVGYCEIESPVREPRTVSRLKRNHSPLLRLDTVLFGVYYPCDLQPKDKADDHAPEGGAGDGVKTGSSKRTAKKATPSRVGWLPKPRIQTCKGYAKFMNIPHAPVTAYIAATSMFTKLPAYRNARLTDCWPAEALASQGRADMPIGDGEKPKFPVIIFSHGLGGSRTAYSSICGELASYGFIVVAVEHRDGSGARTHVNLPENRETMSDSDSAANLNVSDVSRRASGKKAKGPGPAQSYCVDYLFPKDNAQDTSPHNAKGVDTELRTAQIHMRMAEIEEAFHVLSEINAGRGDEVAATNLRRKGNVASSSKGLDGIDWCDWTDRMFLSNVTVMGHSFGGATMVQCLRTKSMTWVGQGIALDAWGPATPTVKVEGDSRTSSSQDSDVGRIAKPLLSIGSEAFLHWQQNFDRLVDLCNEARAEDPAALAWMMTIRGSTHLSQTDFAVLYSRWMDLLAKTIVHPLRALHLTAAPALEFLKMTLPPAQTRGELWLDEEILKTVHAPEAPDGTVTFDHRPDDKWIAVKLKVDNELALRTRSWLRRRREVLFGRGRGAQDGADAAPPGLVDWGKGNEVWMHFSPGQDVVRKFCM